MRLITEILLLGVVFLPGYLFFDILPKSLGYEGFSNWLTKKYGRFGDRLSTIIYIIFFILIIYSLYIIF